MDPPSTPLRSIEDSGDVVQSTTVLPTHIVVGPPTQTAIGVIVSNLRHDLDYTDEGSSKYNPLDVITAGLAKAGLLNSLKDDDEGSKSGYVREQVLAAKEASPLLRENRNTFYSFEVLLEFEQPLAVGLGTESLSMYEVAMQSPTLWERTPISFQCITASQRHLYSPENKVAFSRGNCLFEANWDDMAIGYLQTAIRQLLPDFQQVLIVRAGLGQTHQRPLPVTTRRQTHRNVTTSTVKSTTGVFLIYFDPTHLDSFVQNLSTAITAPRAGRGQPMWISGLKNERRLHNITADIMRTSNPALLETHFLRFDLYLSNQMCDIDTIPLAMSCNVVDNVYFAMIRLPDHYQISEAIAQMMMCNDWKMIIGMPKWSPPNVADTYLFEGVANRQSPCLLIVTSRLPLTSTYQVGLVHLPMDTSKIHFVLKKDRIHTTYGQLMFTHENAPAGSFKALGEIANKWELKQSYPPQEPKRELSFTPVHSGQSYSSAVSNTSRSSTDLGAPDDDSSMTPNTRSSSQSSGSLTNTTQRLNRLENMMERILALTERGLEQPSSPK